MWDSVLKTVTCLECQAVGGTTTTVLTPPDQLTPAILAAPAIDSWGICTGVAVLDIEGAERLALEAPVLTMPAEDISYRIAERFFAECDVRFDTVFLRWDKTRTAQLLRPSAPPAPVRGARDGDLSRARVGAAHGRHVRRARLHRVALPRP